MIATIALVFCATSFAAAVTLESTRFNDKLGSIFKSQAGASHSQARMS